MSFHITYTRTQFYCPNCGKRTVWMDDLSDYYIGSTGYCTSCGRSHECCSEFEDVGESLLKELRNATQTSIKR